MRNNDLPPYLRTAACEGRECSDFYAGECMDCGAQEPLEDEEEELPAPMEFYKTMDKIASEYEKTGKWNLNLLLYVNQALKSDSPTRWDDFKDKLRAEVEIANLSMRQLNTSKVYDDHGHCGDGDYCQECKYWDKEMETHPID